MPTLKIKLACTWMCLIIIIITYAWALIICDFEEHIGRVAMQDKMGRMTKIVTIKLKTIKFPSWRGQNFSSQGAY